MSEVPSSLDTGPLSPAYWGEIGQFYPPDPANKIGLLDYWKIDSKRDRDDALVDYILGQRLGINLPDGTFFSPNGESATEPYYAPGTLLFYDVEELRSEDVSHRRRRRMARNGLPSVHELSQIPPGVLLHEYLVSRINLNNPNWRRESYNFQPHTHHALPVDAEGRTYAYSRRQSFAAVTATDKGTAVIDVVCDKNPDNGGPKDSPVLYRKPGMPKLEVPFTVSQTGYILDKSGETVGLRRVLELAVIKWPNE